MDSNTRTAGQAKASRENGAMSKGPVTEEGKSVVALNAVRHGLASDGPLLLPGECVDAYNENVEQWLGALSPSSLAEGALVARLADLAWRVQRLDRIEHGQQLARLEERVMKTDEFKNYAHTLRALQATNALSSTVEGSQAPQSRNDVWQFGTGVQSVIDIVKDVQDLDEALVDNLVHAAERLEGASAQEVGIAFAAIGVAASEVAKVLADRLEEGRRALDSERVRFAAENMMLEDKDTRKLDRYRRTLDASMARQVELLRQVREEVAKARPMVGAGPQELRLKLRVVK